MSAVSAAPERPAEEIALVSAHPHITPREREVLLLLCDGRTAKEIASALRISPKTVEFHRAGLAAAVGNRSLAHLVRFAVRAGLIQP